MPTLTFSWDLLLVIFFAIVMSYSFIMGKKQAVRLILGSYVALIATEGVSFALGLVFGTSSEAIASIGFGLDMSVIALLRTFLFAVFLTLFLARSGIDIETSDDGGMIVRMISTALLGFSLAGLLATTVLSSVIGGGFGSIGAAQGALLPLPQGVSLTQVIIANHELWYGMPALLLVLLGLVHSED